MDHIEPINVNLRTLELNPKKAALGSIICVAAILILLSVFILKSGISKQNQIKEYKHKIAHLNNTFNRNKGHIANQNKIVDQEVKTVKNTILFFNQTILLHTFPWSRVLETVESNLPGNLKITEFYSSKNFETLHLKGQTDSLANVFSLLKGLDASKIFFKNELNTISIKHKSVMPGDDPASMPILFELECHLEYSKLFENYKNAHLETLLTKLPDELLKGPLYGNSDRHP